MAKNFFENLTSIAGDLLKFRTAAQADFYTISILVYKFLNEPPTPAQHADLQDRIIAAKVKTTDMMTNLETVIAAIKPKYEELRDKGEKTLAEATLTSIIFETYHAASQLNSDLMGKKSLYENTYPVYLATIQPIEKEEDKENKSLADTDLPTV